jgi:hypothetical protein
MWFRKKQKIDVYRPLGVARFLVALNEIGRIKEGLRKRKLTATDVINIETTELGYLVWYRCDISLLTPSHSQYHRESAGEELYD